MKLTEKQIAALKMASRATETNPVTAIGTRKGGVGPVESMNEISDRTARSLEGRGLATLYQSREDYIGGEDHVRVEITDAGRKALEELDRPEEKTRTPDDELRQAAGALRKRAAKAQEKRASLQELNNWFNSLGPEIGGPLARILESHTATGADADSLRDAVEIARAVNAVKEWPPEEETK